MNDEIVKKLIGVYGSDEQAIIRKLSDLLNIPQDEAERMLNEYKQN